MAEALSRVLAALADPVRRDMLDRLAEQGDATVSELAGPYEMSVQAVSKHVQVLERAGLVRKGRAGTRRPVQLEGQVLDLLQGWLRRLQRKVEARYQRLDDVLASLPPEPTERPAPPDPGDPDEP